MHLWSQSFHALAFAEEPKGWRRLIHFNLLHLPLMFVALQTLPQPLPGMSQAKTQEVAGGSVGESSIHEGSVSLSHETPRVLARELAM